MTTTTGKRVSTSRMLRLGRVLALLAERDAPADRANEDDPWQEIPEELDPVDDDATEDDFVQIGKLRRRPTIIYSRASSWPPPENAAPAEPSAVEGDLRVTIRRPPVGRDDEASTADLVADELRRLAAALDHLQSSALRATSRPEAFELLKPMSEKQLAKEARVSTSVLARRRREIVEAPWGFAPLEFYWWKRDNGLDLTEARLLAGVLQSEPDLVDRAVARRVAEHAAAPSEVDNRIDAIRKQVPIMRTLLPLLPSLSLLSQALTEFDLDELYDLIGGTLSSESGHALDKRGRGLIRLALAGAFADLTDGSGS